MCILCASRICTSTEVCHLSIIFCTGCGFVEPLKYIKHARKKTDNLWTGLWMQRSADAEVVLCLLTCSRG